MYLSQLELTGFKSFAKKIVLTFPPLEPGQANVTAIVGPNGSGKSNLADAIRWVTGEQSLKTLRGKKSEDIIFSGTSKSARLGAAEVSLYLNNLDRQSPINYSELVITRKLYRSGESEYFINRSRARLQDILLLMAQLSFGQKSYSIIGQGLADAILSASPSERKDFLNEAAGIKQYQIKRDQAVSKLENTKNNLRQAEALAAEIEPRLRSLTRQVKKLEHRSVLEKKLKDLQIKHYSRRWFLTLGQCQEKTKELQKISRECQTIASRFNALQNQLSKLAQEDQPTDSFEKLQKEYSRLQATKNELLRQKTVLSAKTEILSSAIKDCLSAETQGPKPCSLSKNEAEDLLAVLKETQELQEKLIKEIASANFESVKLLAEKIASQINLIIKKIKKENIEAKTDSRQTKKKHLSALAQAEAEKQDIEQNLALQDQKLKKITEKISDLNREHRAERQQLFHFQKQIQLEQNLLNKCLTEENNLKVELARLETNKENLETEIKQELGSVDQLINPQIETSRLTEYLGASETLHQIQNLKHQLELIGGLDPEITQEFQEIKARFEYLNQQTTDLKKAGESLEKLTKELDNLIKNRFNQSFEKINAQFQKFFKTLFNGGSAQLVYTQEILAKASETTLNENFPGEKNQKNIKDNSSLLEKIREKPETNPTTDLNEKNFTVKEAVDIIATPPGKRLKSINMLSGGERALTSIALICAIISNNPSPFVVLDEVDAALDEANSARFAGILENLSHKTQFIVITHNRTTMQIAKILYGVTMNDDGISKLLSVKLEEVK